MISKIEIHDIEIISLEDFVKTENWNIFVKENGDIAIVQDMEHCLVIRK